jgi:hypothetical protein
LTRKWWNRKRGYRKKWEKGTKRSKEEGGKKEISQGKEIRRKSNWEQRTDEMEKRKRKRGKK